MRLQVQRQVVSYVHLDIPPEVLTLISQFLGLQDVRNVRLVCKLFNFAASQFLLSEVYLSSSRRDLDVLKLVSQHPVFRNYVTDLVYDCRMFDHGLVEDKPAYAREFLRLSRSPERRGWPLTKEQATASHARYIEYYHEEQNCRKNGTDMECLASALPLLPRLSRVIITGRNRPPFSFLWPRRPDLRVGCFNVVLPCVKHSYSISEATRRHNATWRQGILDLFQTLSAGHLTSQLRLLAIGTHYDCYRPSLPVEAFELETMKNKHGCSQAFYHLEKAYLSVNLHESLTFSKSLGHLHKLKLLHVSFEFIVRDHNFGVHLNRMFGKLSLSSVRSTSLIDSSADGISLPSLQDFSVKSLDVAESGLIDFLDEHSRIRRLCFVNIRIVDGGWFTFLARLKCMGMNLEVCEIDSLGKELYQKKQPDTPVIEYLNGRGPNPFEDALDPSTPGYH